MEQRCDCKQIKTKCDVCGNDFEHLIKPEEVNELARPTSCDNDILQRFIEEAEINDLRPRLGDELFFRLLTNVKYNTLLCGGMYEGESCCCNSGTHYFVGLKKTLAYYVYARTLNYGTSQLTRFGFVDKNDEYSNNTDFKQRQIAYQSAYEIADNYMKDCLGYIAANTEIFPEFAKKTFKNNRNKFKILGQ